MYRSRFHIVFLISPVFLLFSLIDVREKTSAVKPVQEYGIHFYNVENLFDTIDDPKTDDADFLPQGKLQWNAERFNKKLSRITEALNKTGAPLLCLGVAEIENRFVLEELAKHKDLAAFNLAVVHHESPDARGIDVGFCYNRKLMTVVEEKAIPVTIDSIPDFKTRDILYVKGKLKNGEFVHFYVNHWPSRRGGEEGSRFKRNHAAAVLRKDVDRVLAADKLAKIVIMGDLNDYPTNESVSTVLSAGQASAENGELFNLMYGFHGNGKGTYNFKGEWGVLDHLIVSKGLLKSVKKTVLVKKEGFINGYSSLLGDPNPETGVQKPFSTYAGNKYLGGFSDHLSVYLKVSIGK